MTERDYGHRDVVDKLGVKPGHGVAFVENRGTLEPGLVARVLDRAGREPAGDDEAVDVFLVAVNADSDVPAVLSNLRPRLAPTGGIWLLTPKRGWPGYVDQTDVMREALATGLVDNKVCSVSEETSAIRFVIRKADRGAAS